jgi:hypothetical protein
MMMMVGVNEVAMSTLKSERGRGDDGGSDGGRGRGREVARVGRLRGEVGSPLGKDGRCHRGQSGVGPVGGQVKAEATG